MTDKPTKQPTNQRTSQRTDMMDQREDTLQIETDNCIMRKKCEKVKKKHQSRKPRSMYVCTLHIPREVRSIEKGMCLKGCPFGHISCIFCPKIRDMCPKECPFRSYLPYFL